MKPTVLLLVAGLLCAESVPLSAQSAPQAPAVTAGPDSKGAALGPEALAEKYVELWNTGKFDLVPSIFEFPAIMTSMGHRTRLDSGTLQRVITSWRNSMPDLTFKIEDTLVHGNKVAVRLVFTGTYRKRLFPNTIDPKDRPRPVRATAMWILETRNGKIRQVWEEHDEARMRTEMGGFWRSNDELEAAVKAAQTPGAAHSDGAQPDSSPKP